jgi:MmyB-like transcription regulator ligand binding domain
VADVQLLLESLRPNPAYIVSRSMDILAANPGGLALYTGIEDWPVRQRNLGAIRSAAASRDCAHSLAPTPTPPT